MKYFLPVLLMLFLSADLKGQSLSPDEMRSDLQVFRKALEAKHPEMYRYTSKDEFSDLFARTLDLLDSPMSLREFYVTMSPLVAALRCGHTKWLIPGKDMYYPFFETDLFPLDLYFHEDKAFVIGSFNGETVPSGGELISLNGESPGRVRDRLFTYLSFGDGYSQGGKYYQLNNFFPGIYSTVYGAMPAYDVEIKSGGVVSRFSLKGTGLEEIKAYQKKGKAEEGPFRFEMLDSTTARLDIDRFFAYPGEENYHRFIRNAFREIGSKGITDLIIDLRGNEGGNENWGIELYRYIARQPFRYYDRITVRKKEKTDIKFRLPLKYRAASIFNIDSDGSGEFTLSRGLRTNKPFKNSYSGKTWLLLDGQSFSVATEFAAKAKSDERCTVVGSETSGGYSLNSSGFFTIVNLPNSGIELGIPLLGFHTAVVNKNNPPDRGVLPDHPVQLSHELAHDSKDHVLAYVLDLISRED